MGLGGDEIGFRFKIGECHFRGVVGIAHFQKLCEGLVVLAATVRFEANLAGEGSGGVGESEEGGGCGEAGGGAAAVLTGAFALEGGGLGSPEVRQMPAGEGHGLDERGFGGVAGLELVGESGGELVILVEGFAFGDGGVGEEPVERGVLGGDAFAFGGAGSGGF